MDGLIAYVLAKNFILQSLAELTDRRCQVVNTLPVNGEKGIIYLVLNSNSNEQTIYDEYIFDGDNYRKINSASIDLSDYWNKSDLQIAPYADFIAELNLQ